MVFYEYVVKVNNLFSDFIHSVEETDNTIHIYEGEYPSVEQILKVNPVTRDRRYEQDVWLYSTLSMSTIMAAWGSRIRAYAARDNFVHKNRDTVFLSPIHAEREFRWATHGAGAKGFFFYGTSGLLTGFMFGYAYFSVQHYRQKTDILNFTLSGACAGVALSTSKSRQIMFLSPFVGAFYGTVLGALFMLKQKTYYMLPEEKRQNMFWLIREKNLQVNKEKEKQLFEEMDLAMGHNEEEDKNKITELMENEILSDKEI